MATELVATQESDPFYSISLALVGGALLVALLVAVGTLAAHSVESLLDRKRSVASLMALGMRLDELESSRRWEARLVAMPMAVAGVLLGSLTFVVLGDHRSPLALAVLVGSAVVLLALVRLAITAAVRMTRPWAVRAGAVHNLRTE